MTLVLIGLPGSGKTSIGEQLAKHGLSVIDSDTEIEKRCGKTIPEIFEQDSEAEFRRVEAEVIEDLLRTNKPPEVLSLGGGAVLNPQVQAAIAASYCTRIYLQTSPEVAASRVGDGEGRPLFINEDVTEKMYALWRERDPVYAAHCDLVLSTEEHSAKDLAELLLFTVENSVKTIAVTSKPRYSVYVGRGTRELVPTLLSKQTERVVIVHPKDLQNEAHALAQMINGFNETLQATTVLVPDAEEQKTPEVLFQQWEYLAKSRLGRKDCIIGLGGGATTDLAGFLAATWLRGVDYISMPTSVLGMVDAGVGGKTGINLASGKNLAGSFYAPRAVICDLDYLKTLPTEQTINGMAEVVKCGFISDEKILHIIDDANSADLRNPTSQTISELIFRGIKVKADVVSADFHEGSIRENLNYGHTFGHALERYFGYRLGHGYCIAVGMVFAAHLGQHFGLLTDAEVKEHYRLIEKLGLPTGFTPVEAVPYEQVWEELLTMMSLDKKVRSTTLRFVLLDSICQPIRREVTDREVMRQISQQLIVEKGEGLCLK